MYAVLVVAFHAGPPAAGQASAASICGLGGASGDRFDVHLQLGASQVPLRVRLGKPPNQVAFGERLA
jgi:hypothetical protein